MNDNRSTEQSFYLNWKWTPPPAKPISKEGLEKVCATTLIDAMDKVKRFLKIKYGYASACIEFTTVEIKNE